MHLARWPFLCAILVAVGRVASADQFQTFTPPGSSLRLSSQSTWTDDTYVHFDGHQLISGRFRFEYNVDSPYWVHPFLLFFPDDASLERLPYLTERGSPEGPRKILIQNPDEAAATLLSDSLAQDLRSGRRPILEGTATIEIDNFAAGFECDAPQFVARLVRVERISKDAQEASDSIYGC